MIKKYLEELAFSPNETRVYLALFDLGKSRAGAIIDALNMHRNLVYTALDVLTERGFVTKTIVRGVAEFSANDPISLIDEAEARKQVAAKAAKALTEKHQQQQEVHIYEGTEGIQRAMNKLLDSQEKEDIYLLGASQEQTYAPLGGYWKHYHKKRIAQDRAFVSLQDKSLVNSIPLAQKYQVGATGKQLPFDADMPFWFAFSDDQLSIFLEGNTEPLSFSITSKKAVDGMKAYFEHLWNQEFQLYYGTSTLAALYKEAITSGQIASLNESARLAEYDNALFEDIIKSAKKKKDLCWNNVIHSEQKNTQITTYPCIQHRFSFSEKNHPNTILLFGEKVVIINWAEEEPILFVSNNTQLVHSYQSYFDQLWHQKTQVFEGNNAMLQIMDLSLDKGEDIYLIAANGAVMQSHPKTFEQFNAKRIQKNMMYYMLANESIRGSDFTRLFLSQVKYLPKSFESPMVVWICGNLVANILWEDPQRVFMTEDTSVADSYRAYYRGLVEQV